MSNCWGNARWFVEVMCKGCGKLQGHGGKKNSGMNLVYELDTDIAAQAGTGN
mgnify:CR=1 FL=1